MTDIERITILETKFQQFEKDQLEIKEKLDELLVLRNKGMGAFWLAASLLGTGIVGAVVSFIQYLKS